MKEDAELLRRTAVRIFTCGREISIPTRFAQKCRPVEVCDSVETPIRDDEFKPIQDDQEEEDLYTWMHSPPLFVTLIKTSQEKTTILIHDDDGKGVDWFAASPLASLSRSCPVGTSLLGQCIVDNLGMENVNLKIMLFDVLQVGSTPDVWSMFPSERYKILRQDCAKYLEGAGAVQIQWAGDLAPVRQFVRSGLPHTVSCVFCLSSKVAPLRLLKI